MSNKPEAKSSILFRHWIHANPFYTAAFEMKDSRGKSSLAFSEVAQAQIDYALAIRSDKGVLLRVQAVTEGMPDYVYLRNEPSYIIIKYPSCIVFISPEIFVHERKMSKRRSLTESQAKKISTNVIVLKKKKVG